MNNLSRSDIHLHVRVLGWLQIASGMLFVLIGGCVFMFLGGIGLSTGDPEATPILLTIGTLVGMLMGILALPSLVAGWGLLTRKSWARILTLVLAVLGLFNVPIGTLIGIYAFWVLLQDQAAPYFLGLDGAAGWSDEAAAGSASAQRPPDPEAAEIGSAWASAEEWASSASREGSAPAEPGQDVRARGGSGDEIGDDSPRSDDGEDPNGGHPDRDIDG